MFIKIKPKPNSLLAKIEAERQQLESEQREAAEQAAQVEQQRAEAERQSAEQTARESLDADIATAEAALTRFIAAATEIMNAEEALYKALHYPSGLSNPNRPADFIREQTRAHHRIAQQAVDAASKLQYVSKYQF